MDNKYKKLVKNTAVFAIGNFGSKVLVFLIVPLYTYMLTTSEYGLVDLITSTMQLMIPFTSLLIQEALIRFVLSKEVDSKTAAGNCLAIFIFGSVLTVLFVPLYVALFHKMIYVFAFVILQILNTFTTIFCQYLRAENKAVAFSVNGVISTTSLIGFNVLLLVVFRLGVIGYILSLILSQTICAIYIIWQMNFIRVVSLQYVDLSVLRQMLKYSLPLIPNSMMWWIMNAGDKYIINYFLGYDANGLYALAAKIPTILTTIYTIFMQAFQMSAIEEMNEKDSALFYEKTFRVTSLFTFSVAQVAIMVARPLYEIVMEQTFVESWKIVPMLCIANVFSCFASFAATSYIISKESQKAFLTTAIGTVLNVVLNLLLIRNWGLISVAFATCVGYFVVMVIRFCDANRIMKVQFGSISTYIASAILFVESLMLIELEGVQYYLLSAFTFVIIMFLYFKEIRGCKEMILKVFRRKSR